jgi:histidine kinase/DNA gyrase B/HSP90-like ATPase
MSPTRQPFSAELHTPGVELAGLLALLGEHLYSTPAVAVLRTDPARRVLIIEDDGAGLTGEEIVADLATIGRGATRGVRDATGTEELIGLFGIGFLSAFVIAHTVTMTTTSWQQPPAGACARGRGRGVDVRVPACRHAVARVARRIRARRSGLRPGGARRGPAPPGRGWRPDPRRGRDVPIPDGVEIDGFDASLGIPPGVEPSAVHALLVELFGAEPDPARPVLWPLLARDAGAEPVAERHAAAWERWGF